MSPNDLALSLADTTTLYVAAWGGVSKSTDCGVTWSGVHMPDTPSNCIWVDEESAEYCIVGGAYGLLFTMDGGLTWETAGDTIHNEVLDFAVWNRGMGEEYWYVGTDSMGVMRTEGFGFSEGPIVSNPYPHEGAWVSLDSFDIFLNLRDHDGIEPSSVTLNVNGIDYSSTDPELSVYDTLLIFQGSFADGETVSVSLLNIEDLLGNTSDMTPYDWEFIVDRTPPRLFFRWPDSSETVSDTLITARFCIRDEGSGMDSSSFQVTFNSLTLDLSSISVLHVSDSFIVDLPTAGLIPDHGDTVNVSLRITDRCDLRFPNTFFSSWSFYIEPTAIEENSVPKMMELTVFPNPFNSSCRISVPSGIDEITIYDMGGRIIDRLDIPVEKRIVEWNPVIDLPSGIYFIAGKQSGMAKILLMR